MLRDVRVLLSVLVSVLVGCSFIGARVPAQPEPTHHCPMGVVVADGLGTAFFLIPPIACGLDGAIGGYSGEYDGVACFVFGVPMAVIGAVYLASTIYGARANRRCERRKEAYVEQAQREQKPGAEIRVRAPVVGDAPMFCAITEPDVGPCFDDETTCGGANPGGTCEPRQAAWCFDVTSIVGGPLETTCAASQIDCDARRIAYTRDASFVVTSCGTYQQRVVAPVAPATPAAP
jgi:hypothetical protein